MEGRSDPVHPVGRFRDGRIPISQMFADSKEGARQEALQE